METRRLCNHGWRDVMRLKLQFWILGLGLAILSSPLLAQVQADTIIEVQVSVEQPIKDGDSAGATEAARQAAFRNAVERAMPPGASEGEKKGRLDNAAAYIKSFRTLSQAEEGGVVKLSLLCQVIQAVAKAPSSNEAPINSPSFRGTKIEMLWRPSAKAYLASEIRRIAQEEFKYSVLSINLQYGGVIVEVSGDDSESAMISKWNSRFQDRALIRATNAVGPANSQEWTPSP